MRELDNQIKLNKISRFQILWGEESYLINAYRQALTMRLSAPEDDMNRLILSADEADEESIYSFGSLAPFMAEKRLLVLRDSGLLSRTGKIGKSELERLKKLFDDMPDTTYVVFAEAGYNPKNEFAKWISARKDCLVTQFKKMNENDRALVEWIAGYAGSRGKKITDGAAKLLIERIGSDMYMLSRELDKIVGYVGEREAIRNEDIAAIASGVMQAEIYELVDAVSNKDSDKAMRLYRNLVYNKENISTIMTRLGFQFDQMMKLAQLEGRGLRQEELAAKSGAFSWKVQALLRMARRFKPGELADLVEYWADLDGQVKTVGLDRQLATELFLVRALTNG